MNSNNRIKFIFSVVLCCFMALSVRLIFVQIIKHKLYLSLSQNQSNFLFSTIVNSKRGAIYDRNGKELAVSVMVDSSCIIPYKVKNAKISARKISSFLGLSYKDVLRKLKSKSSFVWLKRKLEPSMVERLKKEKIDGLEFVKEEKRFYPRKDLACQIIGVAGLDNQGLAGIEYYYDEYLSGKKLGIKIKNKQGVDIAGCSVSLTIDEVIQYIAEKELKKSFEKYSAKAATIIVQDSLNGEILAMASYPNFDPNNIKSMNIKYLKNPAISNIFEPGSTFKVVTAAAGLEEGVVQRKEKIFCENGVYKTNGFRVRDHEKEKWLTFDEVMEKSSNIGMTKIAFRLDDVKLYKYARKFGFGNITDINLPNEEQGMLSSPDKWTARSISAISFGHEIGVTSIQLVSAFSCIANKGILVQPRIVKSIINTEGKTVKEFKPIQVRRVVAPSTAVMLTEILEGVVKNGTGVKADIEGYKVAGKTGTAQKLDLKSKTYSKNKYISSFVGFLPADNPRVTILVVLDEPNKDFWGGSVAAPIFYEVALQIMNYLNISPESNKKSEFVLKMEKGRKKSNATF